MLTRSQEAQGTLGAGPQLYLHMFNGHNYNYAPGEALEKSQKTLTKQVGLWLLSTAAFAYTAITHDAMYAAITAITITMVSFGLFRIRTLEMLQAEHKKLQHHHLAMASENEANYSGDQWRSVNAYFNGLARQVLRDTVRAVAHWDSKGATTSVIVMIALMFIFEIFSLGHDRAELENPFHLLAVLTVGVGAGIYAARGSYKEDEMIKPLRDLSSFYAAVPDNLPDPDRDVSVDKTQVIGFYGKARGSISDYLYLSNEYDNPHRRTGQGI